MDSLLELMSSSGISSMSVSLCHFFLLCVGREGKKECMVYLGRIIRKVMGAGKVRKFLHTSKMFPARETVNDSCSSKIPPPRNFSNGPSLIIH